jgi:hypothetical protein
MPTTFDGAVVKEQGVTFAIAVVKRGTLSNISFRDDTLVQFSEFFGNIPTVLMEQDMYGVPKYYGRKDIVNFLSNIDLQRIPWKRYTIR